MLPVSLIVFAILVGTSPVAMAQAVPRPGNATCPSGYYSSGNACVAREGSGHAFPRTGSCPGGYRPSGDYCVAHSKNTPHAFPKVGSCPSGYRASLDACVAYK
jgi:hypothetical protein